MSEEVEEQEIDPKENIRIAFDEAVGEELDEDSAKMAMIGAGATFKNVTRLYNEFMINAGFAISKADRNQIVEDTLEGRDFETEEDFEAAAKALEEAIAGSTLRSAGALVRSYAKRSEIPCYAKPKSEGIRSNFHDRFCSFLESDPQMSQDAAVAFINGENGHQPTSENIKKKSARYIREWEMVNKIVNQ